MNDKEEKMIDLGLGRDPVKPVVKWMNDLDIGFMRVIYLYMCFDYKVFDDIDNLDKYRMVDRFMKVENLREDMASYFDFSESQIVSLYKSQNKNVSQKQSNYYTEELKKMVYHKDRIIYKEFNYE
jgi:hypothetical protein